MGREFFLLFLTPRCLVLLFAQCGRVGDRGQANHHDGRARGRGRRRKGGAGRGGLWGPGRGVAVWSGERVRPTPTVTCNKARGGNYWLQFLDRIDNLFTSKK